jgi:hypothetical protein
MTPGRWSLEVEETKMPDLQWNVASWDGPYDWSTGGE